MLTCVSSYMRVCVCNILTTSAPARPLAQLVLYAFCLRERAGRAIPAEPASRLEHVYGERDVSSL